MATLHGDGVHAVHRLVAILGILLIAGAGPAAYAAGTSQGSGFLGVVEAYDVRTNLWSSVADMPLPGRPGAAVAAPDGRIYVFGIEGTTSAFAYSPATDGWTPRAAMPSPRSGFAAALGGDGRIYLIGGKTATYTYVNTVQAYDPRTDTWQAEASMPTARAELAAATGPDGRIYALGGLWQNGQFLGDRAFATVEVYTPATDSWATAASMPAPNVGLAATTAPDGRIYAIGGSAGAANVYTPATNQWASAPPLLSPGASAVVTGPDGRIYALGGAYATGGVGGLHGDTIVSQTRQALDEAYRPGAAQWTAISPLPTPRTQAAAATGSDGRIYVFGGFVVLLAPAGTATAVPAGPCRFVLGFQTLHALIPNVVGNCLEDEQHNPRNGDGLQSTTNGLMVWRKSDDFTAFTNGYRTWVNGPHGVQERLNSQRFAWEANPDGLPTAG